MDRHGVLVLIVVGIWCLSLQCVLCRPHHHRESCKVKNIPVQENLDVEQVSRCFFSHSVLLRVRREFAWTGIQRKKGSVLQVSTAINVKRFTRGNTFWKRALLSEGSAKPTCCFKTLKMEFLNQTKKEKVKNLLADQRQPQWQPWDPEGLTFMCRFLLSSDFISSSANMLNNSFLLCVKFLWVCAISFEPNKRHARCLLLETVVSGHKCEWIWSSKDEGRSRCRNLCSISGNEPRNGPQNCETAFKWSLLTKSLCPLFQLMLASHWCVGRN